MRAACASLLIVSAFLFPVIASEHAAAQDGTVHGASIVPQAGSGCFYSSDNSPVLNPFLEPSVPNVIYCKEGFTNRITYQGEGPVSIPGVGQTSGSASKKNYTDPLENNYAEMSINSEHAYCGGQSCYPGAPNDGAFRLAFLELFLKNTVKSLNAKDEPNENLAFRMASVFIVNGKSVSYQLEGGQDLISLKKDEERAIEIFPVAPDFDDQAALADQTRNPYAVDWVAPDISTTPHKELVGGVTFSSKFIGGKWHYYANVNPKVLPGIGKYMVNFRITRKLPETVSFRYRDASYHAQYCGANPNNCTRSYEPNTIGTFTIAYGTEQCLKLSGIPLPSYVPLLKIYTSDLEFVSKSFKTVFGPLNKLGQNSGVRLKARALRRQIAQAKKFISDATIFETSNLKTLTEFYTASELGTVSEKLISKATVVVTNKKKFSEDKVPSIHRVNRNMMRSVGFAKKNVAGGSKIAKQFKKIEGQLKKFARDADVSYNDYNVKMVDALSADRQVRENSFRCEQAF